MSRFSLRAGTGPARVLADFVLYTLRSVGCYSSSSIGPEERRKRSFVADVPDIKPPPEEEAP